MRMLEVGLRGRMWFVRQVQFTSGIEMATALLADW